MLDIRPTIHELRQRCGTHIYAVPYRDGHRQKFLSLPDGAIVETATPNQRSQAPAFVDNCLGLAPGGGPASLSHYNLGLIDSYLALEGVFLMSNGEVAAVYGAEVVPIGVA
jgi:hypothetical protein